MKSKTNILWALLAGAVMCSGCSNKLEEENMVGTVPINFSAKIQTPSTRVVDNAFESGDKVGLYATIAGVPLSGNRYVENQSLTATGANSLVADELIYYPVGNANIDVVAYYPYSSTALAEESAALAVSTKADQRDAEDYYLSDFLVARKDNVAPSNAPVELAFNHKFSRIRFTFVPSEDVDAETLCNASPDLYLSNVCTTASFDLGNDEVTNQGNAQLMTAGGSWSVSDDGNLEGKELIVLPQAFSAEQNKIMFKYDGRVYECDFPTISGNEGSTSVGYSYEVKINIELEDSYVLTGATVSIEDWTESDEDLSTGKNENSSSLYLPLLDFSESNIYRIYSGGIAIADICKEYLNSETLAAEAIVAYPVVNDVPNFAEGTVLQLPEAQGAICGGTLVWDKDNNSFTYTEGTSSGIEQISFDKDAALCVGECDEPIKIDVVAYMLVDARLQVLEEYPVVKVGTQYWMRENLATTYYNDGTAIELRTSAGGSAGYAYDEDSDCYFYNGEAVLTGKLNPKDWQIPTSTDWERLKTYVGGSAAMLKTGTWEAFTTGTEVKAATNETMFSILPTGVWNYTDGAVKNSQKLCSFWTATEETLSAIGFISNSNVFEDAITNDEGVYRAYSVRCLATWSSVAE